MGWFFLEVEDLVCGCWWGKRKGKKEKEKKEEEKEGGVNEKERVGIVTIETKP